MLGDLHPHLMALPYVLLALGLSVELYRVGRAAGLQRWWHQFCYGIAPLVFGALGFLNTWDLPTFSLLGAAFLFVGLIQGDKLKAREWFQPLLFGAYFCTLAVMLYVPLYSTLQSQAQGIGLSYYAKTPLKHYLIVWGLWLPPIFAAVVSIWQHASSFEGWFKQRPFVGLLVAILALP